MDREKMCIAFLIRFIVNDWIQDTRSDWCRDISHIYFTRNVNNQKIKINIFDNLVMALGEEISHLFQEAIDNSYANPEMALWHSSD